MILKGDALELLLANRPCPPHPPLRAVLADRDDVPERVSCASLVRRGGVWGVQACEDGGEAIAVIVRDQSGFRGSWRLQAADGCDLPRVLAEGYCAQGDAGRAGGGPEVVIVLAEGESVWIVRSGRLYGAPHEVRLVNVGGVLRVQTRAEVMEEAAATAPAEEVLA